MSINKVCLSRFKLIWLEILDFILTFWELLINYQCFQNQYTVVVNL